MREGNELLNNLEISMVNEQSSDLDQLLIPGIEKVQEESEPNYDSMDTLTLLSSLNITGGATNTNSPREESLLTGLED